MITAEQKLRVVEAMIHQCRGANEFGTLAREWHAVLKAIADDIRAPSKQNDTLIRLERAIRNAEERRAELQSKHWQPGNLQEIAELTIGRWPTIKHALEKTNET